MDQISIPGKGRHFFSLAHRIDKMSSFSLLFFGCETEHNLHLQYSETVHQLFIYFKKTYDSLRRDVLHNILVQFGVPMKLARLIKMCLN
jgi:hypothetical protein